MAGQGLRLDADCNWCSALMFCSATLSLSGTGMTPCCRPPDLLPRQMLQAPLLPLAWPS